MRWPGLAPSADALAESRAEADARCRALVVKPGATGLGVEASPFGSELYGAAIVRVAHVDASAGRMIRIADKTTGTAELTAPFAPVEPVAAPDPN